MSFYKELQPFVDYIHSIRKLENYLSFDMKFPSKWSLPKNTPEDEQMIPFELDVESLKGISFVTKFDENEISICLVKISKIIKFNKEKEIKEKLFRETVDKLKTTFEKTDLTRLQKLYFDFESEYEENINTDVEKSENTQNA